MNGDAYLNKNGNKKSIYFSTDENNKSETIKYTCTSFSLARVKSLYTNAIKRVPISYL